MDAPAPSEAEQNPLVLVVDDSIDVHRLLNARLRREPLRLAFAACGRDGLKIARERLPALVLLDLNMPDMDGFEVLRQLKDNAETVGIPVIMLSAVDDTSDKVATFELGAIDYVTKPFEFNELRARVRSALRLHRLLDLLAKRAQIDGLTGLWNRTHFDQRLKEITSSLPRTGQALSLAMIDIDHFKSINDNYGHPAGDVAIQALGALIRSKAREADIACRYGGEEFALIMPGTAPADARHLCERVREALEAKKWDRHPERSITCSIGLAGVNAGGGVEPGPMVAAADDALYKAKQGGRNQVVTASGFETVRLRESA